MSYRVIIADDERKILQLIRVLGHWEEYRIEIVDECRDGKSTLESIWKNRPDFVISDIKMPDLDGIELIEESRREGLECLFILVSGYRHFEYARSAIALNVVDYLLKPIEEERLNKTLEKVCRQIDQMREDREEKAELKQIRLRQQQTRLLEFWKFPERKVKIGEPVLEVRDLTGNGDFHINMTLHRGEVLGLAGLVGAGRTELAKMLCGDVKPESGEIIVKGAVMNASSVADAVDRGIGLIPEDRKQEGAFLEYSIEWNIPVMSLRRNSRRGLMNFKALDSLVQKYTKTLDIKTPTVKQLVRNLSGGNQQKVVVAKVLAAENDILIFDEPTRGIDVGAKQEIYKLMNRLVEEGNSILMISSEMEEMLGMSDRIIVLHEGRVSGEIEKADFSQEKVLELASGIVEG